MRRRVSAPRHGWRAATTLLVLALLAAACAGRGGERDDARTDTTDPTDATDPTAVAEALDESMDWLAGILNGGDPDEGEYERRFHPRFRDEVDRAAFVAVTAQVRALAAPPWAVESMTPGRNGTAKAVLRAGTVALDVDVAVQTQPPHRITTLLVRPAPPAVDLDSLDELAPRLARLAPDTALLVAEVTDDTCRPMVAERADQRMPIASLFKLYVLGAVAQQVLDGRLAWDDPVVIRDALDSLPSGTTQDEPAGTTLSVEELARRMIARSDNTATDHLIHVVGRRAVEGSQAALGHGDPSVNVPFATTREMFLLKLGLAEDERAAYVTSSPEERRQVLDDLADRDVDDLDVPSFTEPVAIDTVEWFASPADVCRALVALDRLARQPGGAPVRPILAANPGADVDPGTFTFVGFKGGSEPGVLALSWLLERHDGRRFVLVVTAVDRSAALDPRLAPTAAAAIALLGP